MHNLWNAISVETTKMLHAKMARWALIAAACAPILVALMLLIARNPEISQRLGIVGAKANLIAFAGADWRLYFGLTTQILAMGNFILAVLVGSWIFGREFADGTAKDLLALPTSRSTIVLAKFVVLSIWCVLAATAMVVMGLIMGSVIGLPGMAAGLISHNLLFGAKITVLAILSSFPFAFVASAGRGYLLPLSIMLLTLMGTQVALALGWGELFPWAIPTLYAQGKISSMLSIFVVCITGIGGVLLTIAWWRRADHPR
ncbi:MAG: ABC transporter permease [Candidatus Dependentiae bacterium]|nr:ABC transporter permease [Candidatus Dependentiae bacterium]